MGAGGQPELGYNYTFQLGFDCGFHFLFIAMEDEVDLFFLEHVAFCA